MTRKPTRTAAKPTAAKKSTLKAASPKSKPPSDRPHAHPLDPLTSDEIVAAAAIVRAKAGLDRSAWFETISAEEPTREALDSGTPVARRAFVCCYETASNRTFDGIVDLDKGTLERWTHRPGMQARIVRDEFIEGGKVAVADERFRAACAKRGIDPDKVLVEPWSAGNFGIASEDGERIGFGHCWMQNASGENPYAIPIAGLHPVIDLRRMTVLRVEDYGAAPLPPDPGGFAPPGGYRQDLMPIEIVQPDGPSFTVEGGLVRWQKWHIRLGFNVREGLVLHDIGYEDGGRIRPIMRRASLAEMVVPYGHPGEGHARRNAFDTGEYGVGQYLDPLSLGCDCLGHIRYFDAVTHDWHGAPQVIKNAICMHEEDFGLLWKFTGGPAVEPYRARSRRLVLSSIATIGNYVYGFFWYFYQDGMIGVEVKATGIPFLTGIGASGKPGPWGEQLAPGIESHVHQHVFSYRFEMAVDGPRNAVREVNFAPVPTGPANPYGNAIRITETPLKSERQAQRVMDVAAARYWKVINPEVKNRNGKPVAYKLMPGANALPYNAPDSPIGKRAGYMYKHFWASHYAKDELYPCGWYPNQHAGGEGLPTWTEADRPLENEPVVAWYTMNVHHLPRPEDWPVQPIVYASFHWLPDGFFDRNPALDVPPPKSKHCC